MSPNPYVLLRNLASPHRWFKGSGPQRGASRVEYWSEPTPGAYHYLPGRGWFLVATSAGDGEHFEDLAEPIPVVHCHILDRNVLKPEYDGRKRHGRTQDEHGRAISGIFFRLDDGITWICRWDKDGVALPCNKMQPYVIDADSGRFRVKRRGDCTIIGRTLDGEMSDQATRSRSKMPQSARAGVGGDVHRASRTSTAPSSRPGTRLDSSTNSSMCQTRQTSISTTPSITQQRNPSRALDAPELKRRLKTLEPES